MIGSKSSTSSSSYMYRPREVQDNHQSLGRRVIRNIEKLNKLLTLRAIGTILRVHKLNKPLSLDQVSSVLFIRYDALGDMVVTTPLWRILKRIKPSLCIGVAGSSKNIGLLRADSDVDVIYDYSATSFREIVAKTKAARKKDWDLVVLCKFNQKTRGGIISRLSTKRGYNVSIGTSNVDGHQALFSRLIPPSVSETATPMTVQLQHLLRSSIVIPESPDEHPSIIVDKETEIKTIKAIDKLLSGDKTNKYFVINVDAPDVRKWGLGNNIQLIRHIEETYSDVSTIVLSMPENKEYVLDAIKNSGLTRTHYILTNDVLELVTVVRNSYLVVTPDTGVAHIASAEKKPVLGFYPEAGEWLPYNTDYIVILPESQKKICDIPVSAAITNLDKLIMKLRSDVNASIRDIVSL